MGLDCRRVKWTYLSVDGEEGFPEFDYYTLDWEDTG